MRKRNSRSGQVPHFLNQPLWKHKGIRLAAFGLLLALTSLVVLCIPIRKDYFPELIATFPIETNYQQRYPAAFAHDNQGRPAKPVWLWYPVSENPDTEATEETLREIIGEETLLDFDHYTYAISLGCTIQRIRKTTYLLTDIHNGFRYGGADAILSQNCPGDQGFLYRIPKDWLDIKYYAAFDGNYRFATGR